MNIKICLCYCKYRILIRNTLKDYNTASRPCQKSSTSQLIKGISRVFKNLLKYFNETIISTFALPSSLVLPVIFVLKLNEPVALAPSKSTILPALFKASISLQYCHKLPCF